MIPKQEEGPIRNLQLQQERLQAIRAKQQRAAERFEAQMAAMRAERQAMEAQFQTEIQEIRTLIQHN